MSKDPFQILADELTLIRKDMDQLQRSARTWTSSSAPASTRTRRKS